MANEYVTLAELKARIGIDPDEDLYDTLLDSLRLAASRAVDDHCGRHFYKVASVTNRVFGSRGGSVFVDDFASLTGLVVKTDTADDATFATTLVSNTGYYVENPSIGRPFSVINAVGAAFPTNLYGRPLVSVTALWGWDSVPLPVAHATLIQAQRLWLRKESPSGIMGFGDATAIRLSRLDPDVVMLLSPYKKAIFA